MKAEQHPEFRSEKQRLENTQSGIDSIVQTARTRLINAPDEWSGIALENHNRGLARDYSLHRNKPYYARLDFLENGRTLVESFYLGKRALNVDGYQVYSWAAPIGSLYVQKSPGKATFGSVKGTLLLRRRFEINGKLVEISDEFDRREGAEKTSLIEPSSQQEYLLKELYSRGDPRLQDIVETIQEQQNDLIRHRHNEIVVINGVAGSGKTSVAIHRLAFLLYPGSETGIQAARSIIFCPNPIFLHYVEDLLPSLGEPDVRQVTFFEWALEQLSTTGYVVRDSLPGIFTDNTVSGEAKKRAWKRARLKGSLRMLGLLANYSLFLKKTLISLPFTDVSLVGIGELQLDYVFSADEIKAIIKQLKREDSLTYSELRDAFWSAIRELIVRKFDEVVNRSAIELEKQASELEIILSSSVDKSTQGDIRTEIDRKRAEANNLRARAFSQTILRTSSSRLVEAQVKRRLDTLLPPFNEVSLYYDLFSNQEKLAQVAAGIFTAEEVASMISESPESFTIDAEDMAGILTLRHLIENRDKVTYDHIVVDEVQDFSPLQLKLISERARLNSMTLVGDFAQGIHAYMGMGREKDLNEVVGDCFYVNIAQNYRSTAEIVNLSNSILKQMSHNPLLAVAFGRAGQRPEIITVQEAEIRETALRRLRELQKRYANVALITKTLEQATLMIEYLKAQGEKPTISKSELLADFKYKGGLLILPAVLSKGLEFEAVIVFDGSERSYSSDIEYDGRLLYVAVTRALHELVIISSGEVTRYLRAS